MRREIETVPKDGKLVILEDDTRGTYELARWSTEQSAWVGENGKPIPIIPTHWLPLQRDECLLPEGNEYLLQREAESCGPPDLPLRHVLPLSSDRAALDWPPAQEDVFTLRRGCEDGCHFPRHRAADRGQSARTTRRAPVCSLLDRRSHDCFIAGRHVFPRSDHRLCDAICRPARYCDGSAGLWNDPPNKPFRCQSRRYSRPTC